MLLYFIWRFYLSSRLYFSEIANQNLIIFGESKIENYLHGIKEYANEAFAEKKSEFINHFRNSMEKSSKPSNRHVTNNTDLYDLSISLKEVHKVNGVLVCSYKVSAQPARESSYTFPHFDLDYTFDLTKAFTRKFRFKMMLKTIFLTEETVDYVLPWGLALIAVLTSLMEICSIDLVLQ